MKTNLLIAAVLAAAAMRPTSVAEGVGRRLPHKRSSKFSGRSQGYKGQSGDKLARKAAEGKLGIRS